MKIKKNNLTAIWLILLFSSAATTFAQTTVFTYQGKLTDNGTPQSIYEMQFKLFGSPGGNDQIGGTITNPNVTVVQGVFTVQLNFDLGASAFPGADRYLEISVRRSSAESYVTLNPRQQITSSPYSIRTLSAAQADVALDANKLGGVPASDYVTTSSVGNSFIKNSTTQQTANFNVSGNGTLGGTLQANQVRAQTASGNFGLNHTAGTVTLSSYIGGSIFGEGGWFGTQSNHPLHFFTNNGQPRLTIDQLGNSIFRTANGNINLGAPNSETGISITNTNRADFRFNGTTLVMAAGIGTSVPANTGIAVNTSGNVGIGTTTPNTRLTLNGGTPWTSAGWTASMNLQQGSAFGWEANASGQRFGIGQSNGGLYFFRTNSAFGNTAAPANYDLQITDTGNITQPRDKSGLVKAMIYVASDGETVLRCYNGITNSTIGACGFNVTRISQGDYRIDFGFPVNDRFFSVTPIRSGVIGNVTTALGGANEVRVFQSIGSGGNSDSAFYLIVY